jgi:RNA polymerase sigma factor (sigma-70 family)
MDEIAELWQRKNAGDIDARNELIMRHYELASKSTHYYRHLQHIMRREDMIQYCVIGLIQAVDHYNPERGAAFETYAFLCIKREMYRGLSKENWFKHREANENNHNRVLSMDYRYNHYTNNGGERFDVQAFDMQKFGLIQEDFSSSAATRADLMMAINRLDEFKKECVQRYFFKDQTFLEINEHFGRHNSFSSNQVQSGLRQIKKQLQGEKNWRRKTRVAKKVAR